VTQPVLNSTAATTAEQETEALMKMLNQ
jgi:hypothetical protein